MGPTNGNTASGSSNGGSQLALRNFATLFLINGHRAAFNPVDSVGGFQLFDLNLIPVSAVAKIEIVTDGASAIYGSDAVGGVVNIILKSNYEGFEVTSTYGWSTGLVTGSYVEKSTSITGGVSNGKTSITISAEYSSNTPLYQYQVTTSRVTTGTTNYPGCHQYLQPELTGPTCRHLLPPESGPQRAARWPSTVTRSARLSRNLQRSILGGPDRLVLQPLAEGHVDHRRHA